MEWQGDSGAEVLQDLLECVHQMMVVEARIREPSNTMSQASKNKKKGARRLSKTPPGGLLDVRGVPDRSIPTMVRLRIEQYLNALYWQFAPHLDSVHCGLRS
jgi:hypothetical protein